MSRPINDMLKVVKISGKIATLHALTIFGPNPTQDRHKDQVSWRLQRIAIFLIQDRMIHSMPISRRSGFDTKPLCCPSRFVCKCPKILDFTHFAKPSIATMTSILTTPPSALRFTATTFSALSLPCVHWVVAYCS